MPLKGPQIIGSLILATVLAVQCQRPVEAQAPILVEAAPVLTRAIKWLGEFLVSYIAGKAVDAALLQSKDVSQQLASLEQQLRRDEQTSANDKALILRQLALTVDMKATVDRITPGNLPSRDEAAEMQRRLAVTVSDLQRIQEDHGRRIGKLEEGMESLKYLLDSLTGATAPVGGVAALLSPPSQKIGDLRATASGVQRTASGLRVLVLLSNESATSQVGIAWKAENSEGFADFWKFFPKAQAFLEDESGQRYELDSASGLGFATNSNDWNVLRPGQDTTIVLQFRSAGPGAARTTSRLSLSAELWLAWITPGAQNTRRAAAVVFLNNIK